MTTRRTAFAVLGAALLTASTLTACASGATGGAAAADCTPKHEFSTVHDGKLTVSLNVLPPFAADSADGITGVEGEILKLFAEQECLTIDATAQATAAVVPSVESGRSDLAIGCFYRTEARANIVQLSAPIYTDQMAIISKDGITSIAELEGQTVGTVEGNLWVEGMRGILDSGLRGYPSTLNMNQDLQTGRIEYGIDSYGAAIHNLPSEEYQVHPVEPDERVAASMNAAQIGFPIAPGNAELAAALDEFIAELRADGRLAEILEEHGLDGSAAEVGEPRLI